MESSGVVARMAVAGFGSPGRLSRLALCKAARKSHCIGHSHHNQGAPMTVYIARRLMYGVAILLGVNLLTFVLFFAVNTPDDMARLAIGGQRVSQDAIEKWKADRGYDKPLFYNSEQEGVSALTETIFFDRSVPLLVFDFGFSDAGRDIGHEIRQRMGPSLALAIPTFTLGLFVCVAFALLLVFFRATPLDFAGVVL